MALGALVVTKKIELGNAKLVRCTIVGDGAYPSGGSTGLLAKLKAALADDGVAILGVSDETAGGTGLNGVTYDLANEKLYMRVRTTGVESGVSDQSGITYILLITCY